jgi:predicted transposase YbfD/YdcC
MQHIILEGKEVAGHVFDVKDLATYLNQLHDPRDNRGKIYSLGTILSMVILARLSGEDKPKGIFEWLRHRQEALVQLYGLKRGGTPCLNTIRIILGEVINLLELEKRLIEYLHERYGGQESVLITIDGKTMRGTIPKGYRQGVHLLSAYLAAEGIVLKQVMVPTNSNEINEGPTLLKELNLKNRVVCADAIQTQQTFCATVMAGGGDYLLVAKGNQERLQADIRQYFQPARRAPGWHGTVLPQRMTRQVNKGHGRIETRTLTLMTASEAYLQWPGVQQVFRLERRTVIITTGEVTVETIYGLTSCAPAKADADQLLRWLRAYWSIENGLHYRRDVTLREDATRTAFPGLARAIAIVNNFLVGLVQKLGYGNLPSARRYFDARIAQQLAVCFY